ncbi:2-haloacid dehalogenase [Chitinophaga costaii]|uniref:2-haloacid dehalogenase n=1 Tax=Chitinophaga costaii TaxID=1335309 RepID=A0A1C4D4D9_9BACT|nr:HAD family phosphatase [Chitinophaga costaii]PUZ24450.1 HAD family phosphatase [Chitinophaga costaii]SCC26098.1 2-haloacid dehalogenase [Chitinophaga costaii]
MRYTSIIFDLGAVLIDWNPRLLYRKIFDTETEIDHFLSHVATSDWNEMQDAGRSLAEGTEQLVKMHPQHETPIRAYYGRWREMLAGPIGETVELFHQLKQQPGLHCYALTNWSAETFPIALENYPFLQWFDGIVVSGQEGMRKPTPAFYELLLERYHIDRHHTLFIDDNARNVAAAEALGIESVVFTNAAALAEVLYEKGILPRPQ